MTATTTSYDHALYIDGDWVDGGGSLTVDDLADGGTFARVAAATEREAERALAAAQRAQEPMADATVVERARWLEAIAEAIEAESETLTQTIVHEAGKPVASARSEVAAAAERFRRAVAEARDLQGEYLEGTTAGHEGWNAVVQPRPVGTVACIAPYNYPLATVALQVAPALAAGNSVVLKPSSKTPVCSAILARLVHEVTDVPDGGFNVVPGRSSTIGDYIAGDDRVDAIAMTGSSDAGKHIARESGLVRLHMELGGNAPAIVFPDADLAATADACAKGAFKFAGQRCSAVGRILAHEAVHDDLVDRLVARLDEWQPGPLFDESTAVGPLISESQAEWVAELVDDAVDRGATLVAGGDRDGRWFDPTVLSNVPKDARILHEEQFGPVAAIAEVESEAEALALANADDLGLDAAVFTDDHDRAMRVAEAVEAGAVRINGAPSHGLGDIPFGGVGDSGIGREGLGHTVEEFVTSKSIVL
ncbi:aldehyde dehydrogenase family protein [Haloplanus salinarum]|uniref:aldehyde dehydrogenase family protein n=1 Tax=Haloplanus salinarum TaxID=1912324 RepID=UPI00214C6858|nr:aldehyde dehydrogenase family protein [Haloplanus salinarum]